MKTRERHHLQDGQRVAVMREAADLLRATRATGRRLSPAELRKVTTASRYLSQTVRNTFDYRQAALVAFEAELVLSLPPPLTSSLSASEPHEGTTSSAQSRTAANDTRVFEDLEVGYAQIGERCRGILLVRGQHWPHDDSVWTCAHRHEGPTAAEACAAAELERLRRRATRP